MAVHPVEAANRAAKALKLADVLEVHLDGDDPGLLADLDELSWLRAATLANVSLPSEATRAVVIRVLQDRRSHPDPFDGFGPPEPRDRDGEAAEFARQAWEEDIEAEGTDITGLIVDCETTTGAGRPRCPECDSYGTVADPSCPLEMSCCDMACPTCVAEGRMDDFSDCSHVDEYRGERV